MTGSKEIGLQFLTELLSPVLKIGLFTNQQEDNFGKNSEKIDDEVVCRVPRHSISAALD